MTPSFHRLPRIRLRLASLLLAVFIANILTAGAGLAASTDWLEHEKSHLTALHDAVSPDSPQSAPDQSTGKTQIKHDCHASHFFQGHVATMALIFSPAPSSLPAVSYLALAAPQGAAEVPFRPPRQSLILLHHTRHAGIPAVGAGRSVDRLSQPFHSPLFCAPGRCRWMLLEGISMKFRMIWPPLSDDQWLSGYFLFN